ncbi:MAG TPA: bifunctional 3-(3-hydroxy-phenyl)propionate/3-hydroxycinnamic acid hydroxylase [Ktedonobacteraceae bacterium]|nr:bifunctional 3-(3-hydroxy-phenyl)propionate/3-hydroxycinnamic acid hydroxylase [Ktedonobacteraceae bacterium]
MNASVVIVGAGPTGLAAANLLGQAGINTLILERNPELSTFPKAIALDDEGLRICQSLGLGEEILAHALLNLEVHYFSGGRLLARVAPTDRRNGYPFTSTFYQPEFEQILLHGLQRFPCVQVRFAHIVKLCQQTAEKVVLAVRTPDDSLQEITCAYLLACDGGKSTIRRALTIAMRGMTFAQPWLVLDSIDDQVTAPIATFFCDPQRPAMTILAPQQRRRWEFMLLPGETEEDMLREERIAALLQEVEMQREAGRGRERPGEAGRGQAIAPTITDSLIEAVSENVHSRGDGLSSPGTSAPGTSAPGTSAPHITRKAIYTFHAAIATTFARGRIFLLGDAAHLMPPFGGQGMNSGLRDAHNLCWKLAQVLCGRATPQLLDTYERERYTHVSAMIRFSSFLGKVIMPTSRPIALMRDIVLRILNTIPITRTIFTEARIKPAPRYKRGAILRQNTRTARGLSGLLLPQPEVITADGRHVLLDDVLGPGFAIVCCHKDAVKMYEKLNAQCWQQLGIRFVNVQPVVRKEKVIAPDHAALLPEIPLHVVQTDDTKFLRTCRDVCVVVRPDRYVLGIFKEKDMSTFEKMFQKMLHGEN